MPQLPLPLNLPARFSADNFFVSECNEEAYETILNKKNWQQHALYLHGQKGAGKSHIAYIWAQKEKASFIPYHNINPEAVGKNSVIEDIEFCTDETKLLHLFNHSRDIGAKLLITSSLLPSDLPFTLPDLTSRLRACQLAKINLPDDLLITNVMRKLFSDRQLLVDDEVINYLSTRVERTLESVKALVGKIDASALAQQKNITIPFVRKLLGY